MEQGATGVGRGHGVAVPPHTACQVLPGRSAGRPAPQASQSLGMSCDHMETLAKCPSADWAGLRRGVMAGGGPALSSLLFSCSSPASPNTGLSLC